MTTSAATRLIDHYPRIFFACHRRHYPDRSARMSLTQHQENIISHLYEDEPTNLSRLARHMGVQSSTMSINVERLVRKGLVRRDRAPGDRRQICLRLTAEGVRLKEAATILDVDLVESMLAGLTEEEQERALAGLETLASAADAVIAGRFGTMNYALEQEPIVPCD